MRRLLRLFAGTLLLLALSGCGAGPRASHLSLEVAVATGGLLAAPADLGVKVGGVALTPEQMPPQKAMTSLSDGAAVAAVLSPLEANRLSPGESVLMRLSSGSDLMLLWRQHKVFHWADLKGAAVLSPLGSDPLLAALIERYREAAGEGPTLVSGPASAFWLRREGDFVLVHEPLASQMVLSKTAVRAVSLGVEAGPYPSAVLVVKNSVLESHKALFRAVVAGLWHNEMALNQDSPQKLAAALQPYFPLVSPAALERSLIYARGLGLFPKDPRVLEPVSPNRLEHVFPGTDFSALVRHTDAKMATAAIFTIP